MNSIKLRISDFFRLLGKEDKLKINKLSKGQTYGINSSFRNSLILITSSSNSNDTSIVFNDISLADGFFMYVKNTQNTNVLFSSTFGNVIGLDTLKEGGLCKVFFDKPTNTFYVEYIGVLDSENTFSKRNIFNEEIIVLGGSGGSNIINNATQHNGTLTVSGDLISNGNTNLNGTIQGSGTFTMGGTINYTNVITNSVIDAADDSILINKAWFLANVPTGGGATLLISSTISNLRTNIANSTLVPGAYYIINDFKHIYNLVDHNISSVTVPSLDTPTEPLLVLATGVNTLSEDVKSMTYPSDNIKYDINDTADGHTNGRIFYREVITKNVKANYDIRHEKFRLYPVNVPEYVLANDASYTLGDVVKDSTDPLDIKYYVNVVDPVFPYDGALDLTNRKRWADLTDRKFMFESVDSIGANTSLYNLTADTSGSFSDELGYDVTATGNNGKGDIVLTRGIVLGNISKNSSVRTASTSSTTATPFTLKIRSALNSNIIVKNDCILNGVSNYSAYFSNCAIFTLFGNATNEQLPAPIPLFDALTFPTQFGVSVLNCVTTEMALNQHGTTGIYGNRGIDNRESSNRNTNIIISNVDSPASKIVIDLKCRNLKFLNSNPGELKGKGELLECVFQTEEQYYAQNRPLAGFTLKVDNYVRGVNFVPEDPTINSSFGRITIVPYIDFGAFGDGSATRIFKLKKNFNFRIIRQYNINPTDLTTYYYTIDGTGNESPVVYT